MKSRNQREGKYIPGWCFNPAYRVIKGRVAQRPRAGGLFDLKAVRNFNDNGIIIPGVTLVRTYREGAFE